mmetsp:Transcript_17513/g.51501  ORF Transcript_17513/g.51501 Transcript_17513/m.51501 type:complete len:319 (-) Transcript_17513:86-1042(-)
MSRGRQRDGRFRTAVFRTPSASHALGWGRRGSEPVRLRGENEARAVGGREGAGALVVDRGLEPLVHRGKLHAAGLALGPPRDSLHPILVRHGRGGVEGRRKRDAHERLAGKPRAFRQRCAVRADDHVALLQHVDPVGSLYLVAGGDNHDPAPRRRHLERVPASRHAVPPKGEPDAAGAAAVDGPVVPGRLEEQRVREPLCILQGQQALACDVVLHPPDAIVGGPARCRSALEHSSEGRLRLCDPKAVRGAAARHVKGGAAAGTDAQAARVDHTAHEPRGAARADLRRVVNGLPAGRLELERCPLLGCHHGGVHHGLPM